MRVLITGGTGLIGHLLVRELTGAGHEVIILTRDPDRATALPDGARAIKWDAQTGEGWGQSAEGAGAVVNLAGAGIAGDGTLPSRWTPNRKRLIRESRLNAGRAVVHAVTAAADKPTVVIQSSAIGYYGPRDDTELTESAPPGQDFLARLCVEWEESTKAVEEVGVRHVAIRTGIVLSTLGGALPRMMLPFRYFVGGPLGDGQQWLSWIHIHDVVSTIRFLIDHEEASGVFNLTAPHPARNRAFSRQLGAAMNRPSVVPVPGFALRLLLGEMATTLLDGQRVLSDKLTEMGYEFKFPEVAPALQHLIETRE